ncbi:hypothetical protein [Alkalibacterium sp. 20]|uniref:hypothetical protein n=1 Tax=Alkalibacterium sp. 20 TaxID=1798803 RepID=UPI0015A59969|nr:hypothetical protein [Alkalibacterium sp. 20]
MLRNKHNIVFLACAMTVESKKTTNCLTVSGKKGVVNQRLEERWLPKISWFLWV